MAAFVKFQLDDGTIVYVESTESPRVSSGLLPPGKGDHGAEQSAVSFDQSIASVRKMAAVLVGEMTSGFTETPEEVQVNFGLKASGELGNLAISRGGMEANFNIMLRWRKEKEAPEAKKDEKEKAETKTEE